MILKQTKDVNTIKEVLFHPAIYPNIVEGEELTEEIIEKVVETEGQHFLEVEGREGTLGVFYIHKVDDKTYYGHINMLPEYRGSIALAALTRAEEWLRYNTRCDIVLTDVPKKFNNVYKFLFNAQYELFDEDDNMGHFFKEIR